MKKVVLVAYNGELMCFSHVMLYALDFNNKGYQTEVVIEGSATRLIKDFQDINAPFSAQFQELKEKGLIAAVCQACAGKMGSLQAAKDMELPIRGELKGHPALEHYVRDDYTILTF
jgi:hypothetical protein